MKVCYDFQILSFQKYGGVSRYFYELYTRLKDSGEDVSISCLRSINYYFREHIKMTDAPGKISRRIYSVLNKMKALYDMSGSDIIHPTYYKPYMLGRIRGRLVVTVHDMIHEKYNCDEYTIKCKRVMLHAADALIAISENTKRDILEIYPDIDPDKISVIYHGSSMTPLEVPGTNPFGVPYVLFVGNRGWYKNFGRFVKAMRPILESHSGLCVFCVGGGGVRKDELDQAGDLAHRFHQVNTSDDTLMQAYANAECFVFPSEYEGFGIPVLESFACNCPLVCSRSSSLPEVAGEAAEYFDPLSVEDMSAKIQRVLDDQTRRNELRRLGRERLKLFSWDKTARETLECYRRTLGQSGSSD